MPNPKATLLIVTYNTRDLTLACLEHLVGGLAAANWQLVVVDNASSDGTVEAVRARFPDVECVASPTNQGFAAGNNVGLLRAKGAAVVLLNSDVVTDPATLIGLVGALGADPTIGAISAGLRTADARPQAFAYGAEPTLGYLFRRGLGAVLGRGPLHPWDVDGPIDVDWVSGACLCVRRSAVEAVGPLDPGFFMYFEDVDWCKRLRGAGWRVVYDPRYAVTHLGGASQVRSGASRMYYASLVTFYRKHYGPLATFVLQLLLAPYRAGQYWLTARHKTTII